MKTKPVTERRRQPTDISDQLVFFSPSVLSYLLDRILLEFSFFLGLFVYIYMFSDAEDEERELRMCIINVHLVVTEQKDA